MLPYLLMRGVHIFGLTPCKKTSSSSGQNAERGWYTFFGMTPTTRVGARQIESEEAYHAACAAALATEILVDLYTFFSPPTSYHQLFVLDPRSGAAACPRMETDAVNGS
jgi:hypothetical protein